MRRADEIEILDLYLREGIPVVTFDNSKDNISNITGYKQNDIYTFLKSCGVNTSNKSNYQQGSDCGKYSKLTDEDLEDIAKNHNFNEYKTKSKKKNTRKNTTKQAKTIETSINYEDDDFDEQNEFIGVTRGNNGYRMNREDPISSMADEEPTIVVGSAIVYGIIAIVTYELFTNFSWLLCGIISPIAALMSCISIIAVAKQIYMGIISENIFITAMICGIIGIIDISILKGIINIIFDKFLGFLGKTNVNTVTAVMLGAIFAIGFTRDKDMSPRNKIIAVIGSFIFTVITIKLVG